MTTQPTRDKLRDPTTCAHAAVEVHCGVGARCITCGEWATFGNNALLAGALDALVLARRFMGLGGIPCDPQSIATVEALLRRAGRLTP